MKQGKIRIAIGFSIVIATIAAFTWYVSNHPEILDQLSQTAVSTILTIVLLYAGVLGALILVLYGSLMAYKKTMSWQENFLLNAYSSLVNFFGPGQSGPGFRAAYLKIKHGVKVKQYIFLTLIYYAFYAFFSGVLLAAAAFAWWVTCGILIGIILACWIVLGFYMKRNESIFEKSNSSLVKPLLIIGAASLLQVILLWIVYFVELRSLDASISLGQAAIYTGAANFALFVALTPGAIGFREAFLVFSQSLHHIPNNIIVAANILDRAVYILFLGILFVFVLALHANKTLQVKKIKNAQNEAE
jgi:uncharacterized membrane protein YbhN (UPF0104 family)